MRTVRRILYLMKELCHSLKKEQRSKRFAPLQEDGHLCNEKGKGCISCFDMSSNASL